MENSRRKFLGISMALGLGPFLKANPFQKPFDFKKE
jgi:hypothetical protein